MVSALDLACCIDTVCFCDVISDGRGMGVIFFAENLLFDSAYVAYLSVLGVALLLFEVDKPGIHRRILIHVLLILFLAVVIYSQRLNGPILLFVSLLCLKVLTFLPERILRGAIIAGMIAVVLLFGTLLMKAEGASDPSLHGIRGGPYLFDEHGMCMVILSAALLALKQSGFKYSYFLPAHYGVLV